MTRRVKWILALLIPFVAFDAVTLTVIATARRFRTTPAGTVVSSGTAAIGGPFTLTAADGRTVTDQTYRDKWVIVYFGYTFCPDACPTALSNVSVALQKLGKQAERLQPLFITLDPNRDTREVLSTYLESFDPRIVGLVGTEAQTDAIAKAYRVYFERHKDEGGNYPVDHSAYFYLMGPDGKFADVIDGTISGNQMADQLRKLIGEHPT
jgi:protein SCO1/2